MKEHKISLITAILLTMNIMIGSGILIGPGNMAAIAGNASFLAWLLAALLFLPMVLCTAQLSRMFPISGGFYAYAREGINLTAGFVSGWVYLLGYTFVVAVEVLGLRQLLLCIAPNSFLLANAMIFNVICITIFSGLNLLSFKFFSRLLNSLTITKILPAGILIILLPFVLNWKFTISAAEFRALPNALPFALFGLFGFEYCTSLAHLIENSERNAPRAAVLGFLGTAGLYTLFHFGTLNLMGAESLAQCGAAAFAQFLTLPIPFLKPILMVLIPLASILIIFAAGCGILNANVMIMEAMARDNLFWKSSRIAQLNRNGRPWVAVLAQAIIIFAIVTIIPSIKVVAGLCNLGIVLSFLLPFTALLLLQKRRSLHRAIPLTVLAIMAALGLACYSWYEMGATIGERMLNTLPMIIALLMGMVLFALRSGKKSKLHRQDEVEPFYH